MTTSKSQAGAKTEIIITGFGGQGIVLAGQIVGKAASLIITGKDPDPVYGPEARGGYCSAQVIIADRFIHFPYVRQPDILVCMSQGGFDKYAPMIKETSILIVDQHMVSTGDIPADRCFAIPATRLAEELGRKMMANIVMVGFFTAITQAVSLDAARNTVSASVPRGTEALNLAAFDKGYDFGLATLKGRRKKAEARKGAPDEKS